ncbi:hypothetical protein PVK06_049365 [Gossypium arboreum]|uniref:Major facilitator superfamily (MFS) profile domain-containing protein n=1 Tax=Gossypium arboreum TaxID=29729 RepID=A0ABR0MIF8_GOSAR|nr:hypothetical protein PVK06_049365 [Gossypium arboreum]
MVEEGTDEGPTNEPLIVSSYNGDGLTSRKSSPITPSLVLGVTVAANASFTCGYSGRYSAPAESGIIDELGLTVAECSVFGSIITIEEWQTFWILNIFYIMGWLAIVFAQEAWSLYVGRLSLGFGTAVFNYVVTSIRLLLST